MVNIFHAVRRISGQTFSCSIAGTKSLPFLLFYIGISIANGWTQQNFLLYSPEEGQQLFEAKGCQQCHAIRGKGGDVAKDFGWKEYYGSAYDLAADLWNHSPIMGEIMEELNVRRPTFTKSEMSGVLSFLYYQRFIDKTGDVVNGKRLLQEKECLKCHSVRGKGSDIGPRLDKLSTRVSPLYMAQAMWNHGPEMASKMKTLRVKWPKFKDDEIIDLTNYLRILRMESPPDQIYMYAGQPEKGKQLFEDKQCGNCHGFDERQKQMAPSISRMPLNQSVTGIAGMMWNHGLEMMQMMQRKHLDWPEFQGSDMADLISYLYYVRFTDGLGEASKGKDVFEKKDCVNCHVDNADRESEAPPLSEFEAFATPVEMVQVMWNHAPNMQSEIQRMGLEWPELSAADMKNLYAFLSKQAR